MSKNKVQLVLHHGSPGTPDDFKQIEKHFDNFKITKPNRIQSTHFHPTKHTEVGYSFGSVKAILDASKNPEQTDAVILVSPYIFINDKPSILKKSPES